MPNKGAYLATVLAILAGQAGAQTPLSAIDWLSTTPTVTLDMDTAPGEPPVAESATSPEISVGKLGEARRDAVGLLPASVTGLPATLWQSSRAEMLARLIAEQRVSDLPAMQALLYTLLLAEANPPLGGSGDQLLLARIDKLVDLGALEQANALLERAGADTPALFARWFDVTLLMGQEDTACDALLRAPHLAPGYAARIFCTARSGDWQTAALTLGTANALGLLSKEEDALLLRFLDPEVIGQEPILVAARKPSPLLFRLYEAVGESRPTTLLPRAFAHADLRDTAGWKAQLEAAERLARTGALPGNHLLGLYTEREPAASGMIWERVTAVQNFDAAMRSGDEGAIADTIIPAWEAMRAARLEVPFAGLYASDLLSMTLSGPAQDIARRIVMLSPRYEAAAERGPADMLAGLARGSPPRTPSEQTARAIADAFHGAGVPQELSAKLARGQLGEVILRAMQLYTRGAAGDPEALTKALASLRALGLEDTARRAALQVLLLERRI
ncbi:hypothetical protein SAMN04490248_11759 [Salinihabitans flavidus]|uniref:Uncharacterized protein n=1 Tax=Salinihabitans flavidus TaxID=569882 RepID=A0A1H8TZG6_9RHOB|nr:hypothetical protein [Salinihabitans flavidus]SEO95984.1 hypothetical protein SAMN04490248_11759 [Salinihabitans flavidus]